MIDSEYLFRLVLGNLEGSDWDAVLQAIEAAREEVLGTCTGHSSLTLLLTDGDFLYAYREFADRAHEDYYTLFYAPLRGGWLVSSEPLAAEGARFELLGNRALGVFGPCGMEILRGE